jgi:NAD(P)-dependent dehydrogenase (short-subunit alcohol dehydrogenase family)
MAAGDGGSIINVSSIAAVQPTPTELPYGMAKAGLNALTLGLARAYAPKVRVNCIMPGPFLTDISKAWDMEAFEQRARKLTFPCSAAASRTRWLGRRCTSPAGVQLHHRRYPEDRRRLGLRAGLTPGG